MAVTTLNGFVLIDDVVTQEKISEGGIYMGENANDNAPVTGTVMSVPEAIEGEDEPCPVKKGDKVLFKLAAASPLKIDGGTYYIIGHKSLIGIIS